MKHLSFLLSAALLAGPALAAGKPCEELKTEIAAKLDAKGVKNYELEVLATEQEDARKVVGSCEQGKKKIVYARKG